MMNNEERQNKNNYEYLLNSSNEEITEIPRPINPVTTPPQVEIISSDDEITVLSVTRASRKRNHCRSISSQLS